MNHQRKYQLNKSDKPKKKFTLKDYEKDENRNYHTNNALNLVKQYGTPKEIAEMEGIAKRHGKDGINHDDYKRRYEISDKYYDKLVKDSKEPKK